MLYQDICGVQFLVGNRYWVLKNPKKNVSGTVCDNGWAMFVKLKDPKLQHLTHKLIDQVQFKLHYTFKNPNRIVKSLPGRHIEFESWGWGYFDIPITIFWNKGTGMKNAHIEHELCFEGTGKSKTVTMMMNRDKVNALLGLTGDNKF